MEKKSVTFTFEGDPQRYVLTYDFNKIVDAESETGCNLSWLWAGNPPNSMQLRAGLYALLKTAHAVLLPEAGDLLSKNRKIVLDAVGELLQQVRSEEEEPEVGIEEAAAVGKS